MAHVLPFVRRPNPLCPACRDTRTRQTNRCDHIRFLTCDHCGHAWHIEQWSDASGHELDTGIRPAYEIQQQD